MTTFGYVRVSTVEQNTEAQEQAIRKAYPDAVIRSEKVSGRSMDGREVLKLLLDMVGNGDRIVVHKLDRVARNLSDLLCIVQRLENVGASLVVLGHNIDTGTATGKAFLQMLGVFAEFETDLRKERQQAGIQRIKAGGKTKTGRPTGRPAKAQAQAEAILQARASGQSTADIAASLGLSRSSVYAVLKPMK